jgi:hypothetical protein
MKQLKSKQDLIDTVLEQIKLDVHTGDLLALDELLGFMPNVNLIEYLPEEDWKQFKHLRNDTTIA